jgi:dTDP-4-amino-4,6-dideoxygalactose transaminase
MDPHAQYASLTGDIERAVGEVIGSGRFILGPNVSAFETEAAAALGTKHSVGVANGTDALVLALRALEIGAGDEVICPAYTFYATAEAIGAVGATPVFADIDDETYCLDLDSVRERITGRTKAIMPVHLFGHVADMDAINALAKERGLAVIEDSAQAWGATYKGRRAGSMGDAATFSFFPTKNLPCFGDGGLVATGRDDLHDMVRQLRFHGSKDKVTFTHIGYNSRLDEIQAAILRILMQHVDSWNAHRRQVAAWYAEAGLGEFVGLPAVADGCEHIYHLYMARSTERDAIAESLKAAGVGAAVYYATPLHLQPVFQHLGYGKGDLPVTEAMSNEGLALPMFATMSEAHVATVVDAVRAAVPAGVS